MSEEEYEDLIEQYSNVVDELHETINDKDWEIDQLKQQLVKKDKEIEKLKQQYTILENENGKLITELIMDKYKKAQKEVSFGTQLAIQELEKVKNKIEKRNNGTNNANYSTQYKDGYSSCCCDIEEQIDQQIKELKGEKDATS